VSARGRARLTGWVEARSSIPLQRAGGTGIRLGCGSVGHAARSTRSRVVACRVTASGTQRGPPARCRILDTESVGHRSDGSWRANRGPILKAPRPSSATRRRGNFEMVRHRHRARVGRPSSALLTSQPRHRGAPSSGLSLWLEEPNVVGGHARHGAPGRSPPLQPFSARDNRGLVLTDAGFIRQEVL
jgi:hypothetical protein